MSIPLDVAPGAVVKGQGGFRRKGTDGPPYVPSLTNTRQPKGTKAELIAKCEARGIDPTGMLVDELKEALGAEPADELYGRPSGFGDPLENSFALRKYIERGVAAGVVQLIRDGLDPDAVDLDDIGQMDRLVIDAQDAVDSMIWADRGTHVHLLIERWEKGEDWAALLEAGEALGIPWALQEAIVGSWVEFRVALGLRSLACELAVVNDTYRIAGTLDLLDVADRDIVTEFGTICAGTAFVGDIKTGEPRDKYAVQVCGYVDGVPFNTDTEQRLTWEDVT